MRIHCATLENLQHANMLEAQHQQAVEILNSTTDLDEEEQVDDPLDVDRPWQTGSQHFPQQRPPLPHQHKKNCLAGAGVQQQTVPAAFPAISQPMKDMSDMYCQQLRWSRRRDWRQPALNVQGMRIV